MTSTGSVLSSQLYEWFYREAFPRHTQLISMSGGTDIAGSCKAFSKCYFLFHREVDC